MLIVWAGPKAKSKNARPLIVPCSTSEAETDKVEDKMKADLWAALGVAVTWWAQNDSYCQVVQEGV